MCDSSGKLKNVITIVDLMAWLASFDDKKDLVVGEKWAKREELMNQRTVAGIKIREGTIADVVKFAQLDNPYILNENESAIEAAKLFAKGVKQVIFVDHALAPKKILTQHDLTFFVHTQLLTNPACMEMAKWSLSGLGLAESYQVRTASIRSSLRDAVAIVNEHGGALALVDQIGVLRANFSPLDLKGVLVETAPSFNQNVHRFLMSRSYNSLQPIQLLITDSLLHASELFFKFGIHHLWIVDEFGHPKRCFSMTDFLNLAIHSHFVEPELIASTSVS